MDLIFRILRNLFYIYYRDIMGPPYRLFKAVLPDEYMHDWTEPLFKATLTLMILLIARHLWLRIAASLVKHRLNQSMSGHDVREPYTVKDTSFVEELDMAQHPVSTLESLKKEKRYGSVAEVYAKLNEPSEAARWFIKDRQYQRAAEELAKAGKTLQAAKMLQHVGDYQTAARFYSSIGRHKKAAAACMKGKDFPAAACAYAEGGYHQKAADIFMSFFKTPDIPPATREAAADQCYRLLQKNEFADRLSIEQRNQMFKLVGQCFLAAGRHALAATLFQESGDTKLAAVVYKHLQQARRQSGAAASSENQ